MESTTINSSTDHGQVSHFTTFVPTKVDFEDSNLSRLTSFFFAAHNFLHDIKSPVEDFFENQVPRLAEFTKHEHSISNDPIGYLKNKEFTVGRKVFDFTIGGPAAALTDLIGSVLICGSVLIGILFVGAKGLWDFAWSKGKDTENLQATIKAIASVAMSILHAAKSVLRLPPVVGVFLGYLASIAIGACVVGVAIVKAKIDDE